MVKLSFEMVSWNYYTVIIMIKNYPDLIKCPRLVTIRCGEPLTRVVSEGGLL